MAIRTIGCSSDRKGISKAVASLHGYQERGGDLINPRTVSQENLSPDDVADPIFPL